MSEKIKSEMISRRGVFSLLGIAAALGSVPATLLAVSDAEAQATGDRHTLSASQESWF